MCHIRPDGLTPQWPYHCLTDRVIFFLSGFWPGLPVATPRSHRPGFFHFFLRCFWPRHHWPYQGLSDRFFFLRYFRLGHQWPYHGLIDRVRVMVTDVLGQKSDKKTLVCEAVVWPLTLKKPSLGDRGMTTGVFKFVWSLAGANYKITNPVNIFVGGGGGGNSNFVGTHGVPHFVGGNGSSSSARMLFVGGHRFIRWLMSVFAFSMVPSSPSIPHHRIFGNPEDNSFNASVRHPAVRGGFDRWRTTAALA